MKSLKLAAATAALMLAVGAANAAPILLDLSSGTDSIQNGAPFGLDTYVEGGFRIQMDRAGDHIDRGFLGDLGFHNGPANPDDITWTLSKFGLAFSLLSIDLGGFANGFSSLLLTASNGATQTVSTGGLTSILGMGNVTFVQFDILQDGGIQAVGMNGITVDNAQNSVPVPGTLALLGIGLAGLGALRRKQKAA